MHSQISVFESFPLSDLEIFLYFPSVTFLNWWLEGSIQLVLISFPHKEEAGPISSDGNWVFLPSRMRDEPDFSNGKP